jgi:hypothetical protein
MARHFGGGLEEFVVFVFGVLVTKCGVSEGALL